MRDPYSLLGVKRDADADEIKAAWRSKAKTLHPDHNQDDPLAAKRFSEVGAAYEVLKDPERRRRFDKKFETQQTIMQQREAAREAEERAKAARAKAEQVMEELARANAQRAQAQAAANAQSAGAQTNTQESAEDMVERIFGNGPAAASGTAGASGSASTGNKASSASSEQPRQQAQAQAAGAQGHTASAKKETAGATASAADEASEPPKPAPPLPLQAIELLSSLMRRIRGEVPPPEKAPDLNMMASVTLDALLGLDYGQVTLPDEREVRFPLTPGMTDGHQLRLKGQGLRLPGMQRGDLVITLSVARDPRFSIEGFDLHTVLKIKLEEAVLGGEAEVETPGGKVPVSIPAWTGSDQIARLGGLGLMKEDGERGDLVVEFRVLLWEKPDEKVIDLMRHMRYGLYV